jgi:glycosyltransferase involved in cell wall biosynthesis
MARELDIWSEHSKAYAENNDPSSSARVDFRYTHSQNIKYANKNSESIPPELSVVIPALNEDKRLDRLLASLNYALNDTSSPTEIIVVNNGSNDLTKDIAEDFGVNVVDEPREGIASARQAGLEATNPSSTFILTTDADSIVPKDWINKHSQTLCDPCVNFSYGGVKFRVDQEATFMERALFSVFTTGRGIFRKGKKVLVKDFSPVAGANSGFQREHALEIGYRCDLAALEDYCLYLDITDRFGGKAQDINSTIATSARRIIGTGVTPYIKSRLDFNRRYYLNRKLDQPTNYDAYR